MLRNHEDDGCSLDVDVDLDIDDATPRWQSGDHAAAMVTAFSRAGPALLALARRMVGNDDAADIVQEALLRVWNHPERFDPARGTLGAYLIVTTRGTALDHIRQVQRRRLREQRGSDCSDVGPAPEPIDALLLSRLQTAVDALRADQHELIDIAFFRGVSYRQIATELGLPEGTVKSRMRRTLTRLRDDLRSTVADDDTWN
jgi:RNA polymerase sigma-70 factor (ECF subfamily)